MIPLFKETIPLFKVLMDPAVGPAVTDTLYSGQIAQGPKVEELEKKLQEVWGLSNPPITTSSGTAALDLALHLAGVGPGDEVITTPMTCTATNAVIVRRGARPVWADITPSGMLDTRWLPELTSPRTKAIMAVEWGGQHFNREWLGSYRTQYKDMWVIIDGAHSFRAGKYNDDLQTMRVWSFQAIKTFTTGDGGALAIPGWACWGDRARRLRWFGLERSRATKPAWDQKPTEAGYKYHMNDIAATIGLANLQAAIDAVKVQQDNGRWYNEHLPGEVIVPLGPVSIDHTYWLYTISVEDPRSFMEYMKDAGVEVSPVHRRNDIMPAYHYPPDQHLLRTGEFNDTHVCIPCGWWVTDADRTRISRLIWNWERAL